MKYEICFFIKDYGNYIEIVLFNYDKLKLTKFAEWTYEVKKIINDSVVAQISADKTSDGFYKILGSSAIDKLGPLVYDIALIKCSLDNFKGILPDSGLTESAQRIYKKYLELQKGITGISVLTKKFSKNKNNCLISNMYFYTLDKQLPGLRDISEEYSDYYKEIGNAAFKLFNKRIGDE